MNYPPISLTRAAAFLGALLLLAGTVAAQQRGAAQNPPQVTFKASADVIAIEATIVTKDSAPLPDLKPEQVEVTIDGKKRPVATLDFVRASTAEGGVQPAPSAGVAPASTTPRPDGRIFILGIDQTSFPVSGEPAAREAARRLIERLAPEDYLGLVAYPGPISIAPTRDRQKIRDGLTKITGLWTNFQSRHSVSAAEATAFQTLQVDPNVARTVIERECQPCSAARGRGGVVGEVNFGCDEVCADEVTKSARELGSQLEMRASQSIAGLFALFDGVAGVPGRKTVVIISAGIPASTRPGGRPDVTSAIANVASRAERANANLYVLYMDIHFLGQFGPRGNFAIFDDIALFGRGLGMFAGGAGGEFYQVETGADHVVERLVKETSSYYMIGVAVQDSDRDGKEHLIAVRVNKGGARVLSRRSVTIPKKQ